MSLNTLENQHVVIVGGSSGIGLATGHLVRQLGAAVTLISRDAEKLHQAAKQLDGVQTAIADFADETAISAAFADLPPIDHVYVAAGSFVGGNILEGNMADFRQAIDTRVWGSVHVVRAAVPKMNGTGSLTFTGGLSTDRPVAGAWATAVATAAAEQLARALALELAPIRVNAVSPGWTDTPMWDDIFGEEKQNVFSRVATQVLSKRLSTAAEVAQAVIFLMNSRTVTGEVIHVDSGHRLV
ncbi:MAG: SDR family oxidoreductase [Drouetiella hepatica Uher 2000/2452]|jgi:NAD(P)-dependent dehydrogenase (short-subunit alcohol dehydrogenase family)|uniref:SDR family oxidoreductase n=1 Tax=Drouetiella hepatica Uher 2000/2452 TaxID=904376 RepID=A0A951QGC6_9CYAN|nr:SDR family oxidoreductase [Drouetiella hepatica Uher 2000/2452]